MNKKTKLIIESLIGIVVIIIIVSILIIRAGSAPESTYMESAEKRSSLSVDPAQYDRQFVSGLYYTGTNSTAYYDVVLFVTNGDGELYLSGWAFIEGVSSDSTKTYLLLDNEENTFILSADKTEREDIAELYGDGSEYKRSGFEAVIENDMLSAGKYRLYLYLISDREFMIKTENIITRLKSFIHYGIAQSDLEFFHESLIDTGEIIEI